MLFSAAVPPTNHTPIRLGGRVFGTGFATGWLLLWSFCTLAIDLILIVMVIQTLHSWSYPVTHGAITQSEVRRKAGANEKSIRAEVKYQFRVADRDFTGSTLSFFKMNWSSRQEADRVVQSLPVGQQVEVFYNPSDPNDSALSRSLDGRPLFFAALLLPFNLVMIGGLRGVWRSFHGIRNQPMQLEGDRWIVRRSHGSPLVVALIVAGAISFVSVFAVGTYDLCSNSSVMSVVWLLLISLTCLAYWNTWSSARNEPPVLITHNAARSVTWPASMADNTDLTISATQFREVKLDVAADGETDPSYSVLVTYVADDGQATTRLVLKTSHGNDAELLADWLDDWSGLGLRRQLDDAETEATLVNDS